MRQSDLAFHEPARRKLADALAARSAAGTALAGDAELIAGACHAMAARFHRGGKLLVFGNGASSTDAQHVAVEFVHPVIVGKRALPAIALTNDIAATTAAASAGAFMDLFAAQIRQLGTENDIAMGLSTGGDSANVWCALEVAHRQGLLTLALCGDGGNLSRNSSEDSPSDWCDWCLRVHDDDPLIVKEVQVTAYHILWELAHVFFEQPGVLGPGFIG